MAYLSEKTFERIAEAITEAETKSRCEIVAVFTARSDDYRYVPMVWAAMLSLFVPFAAYTLLPLDRPDLGTFALAQWLLFMLLLLLFRMNPPRLLPVSLRQKRAEQQAARQFITQGLNSEKSPPAVLFFVSFDERYVRILSNAKVPIADKAWREIIDAMVTRIHAGEMDEGMVDAVRNIGATLAAHCPANDGAANKNRYPNRLVIF